MRAIELLKDCEDFTTSSFFIQFTTYILTLVPQLIQLLQMPALSRPKLHFIATLLAGSVVRHARPSSNLQIPGIQSQLDATARKVLYHHACAIWVTLENQLRQVRKRCLSKEKLAYYGQAVQVIRSMFVSRQQAETIEEANLSLHRESYGGYRYICKRAYVVVYKMSQEFDRRKGTYEPITKVGSITERILTPALEDCSEDWIARLESCPGGLKAPHHIFEMLVKKSAAKLFWGRVRQFVRLRNSYNKRDNNDKLTQGKSGTVVEVSRNARRGHRSKKRKRVLDLEGSTIAHVELKDRKSAKALMGRLEAAKARGQVVYYDIKWMFEQAERQGDLELVSGNRQLSFFTKHDIWRLLWLCGGTKTATEEEYKHNYRMTAAQYFEVLLKLFEIQVPVANDNVVNDNVANDGGND